MEATVLYSHVGIKGFWAFTVNCTGMSICIILTSMSICVKYVTSLAIVPVSVDRPAEGGRATDSARGAGGAQPGPDADRQAGRRQRHQEGPDGGHLRASHQQGQAMASQVTLRNSCFALVLRLHWRSICC